MHQTFLDSGSFLTRSVMRPARREPPVSAERVRVSGKLFRLGDQRWYLKGLTYGPFAPNSFGEHLPERPKLLEDFVKIRELGANAIRLYHPPSLMMLDDAWSHGLRVLVDVPWEKHRCFFEDWS